MKEPFVTLDNLIPQAKILGDMELQAYLANLSDQGKQDLINQNINSTMKAVENSKESRYSDLLDQATGADNNITSAAYYLTRTRDLTDLAKDVGSMTRSQYSASLINNGLSGRQTEINEWANSNKLDTLYFFQILFISLTLVGIFCFLLVKNIINHSIFIIVCYFIGFIAVAVLILRWRYTRVSRDSRYWNKARFGRETDMNLGNVPKPVQIAPVTYPAGNCVTGTISSSGSS
jgi:F0F1-type ATP synthase assembly protein I